MTDTRYKDAEWLQEQYHENKLLQAEIGEKCGVCAVTVGNWMRRHDIERRDRGHVSSDARYRDAEWLHEQYHENELSQAEIANKCGIDQTTVSRWMRRHDIERRHINCRTGVGIVAEDGYQMWHESSLSKHVLIHRLLAVAEYGFDAVCDMEVHHQNGIKWDNRPDNIEVLTPSEHRSHHACEQFASDDTRHRDAGWLKEQYHEHELSTYEIADKCDVSNTTVRRWMQKHDIERRDRDSTLADKPTGQLTLEDTRKLEGAQTVNQ